MVVLWFLLNYFWLILLIPFSDVASMTPHGDKDECIWLWALCCNACMLWGRNKRDKTRRNLVRSVHAYIYYGPATESFNQRMAQQVTFLKYHWRNTNLSSHLNSSFLESVRLGPLRNKRRSAVSCVVDLLSYKEYILKYWLRMHKRALCTRKIPSYLKCKNAKRA